MDLPTKKINFWFKFFLYSLLAVWLGTGVFLKYFSSRTITQQRALEIVEKTPEIQALYKLQGGRFSRCVEKKVLRPCDSQWVTCIEDAWVVEFNIGEACQVHHDGRLNIHILVDSKDGRIISRFPEAPYFQKKDYCHEAYDCFCSNQTCVNFVYGQIDSKRFEPCQNCSCQDNMCSR
jgi:hypothetical protein